jgi:hypothetical protein
MGATIRDDALSDQETLTVLDQAGLKQDIIKMKGFDLRNPAQAVAAQEHLDELLSKINKALEDAAMDTEKMAALDYKDPNSGDAIRTSLHQSGRLASLNSVIQAFDNQSKTNPADPQNNRDVSAPASGPPYLEPRGAEQTLRDLSAPASGMPYHLRR